MILCVAVVIVGVNYLRSNNLVIQENNKEENEDFLDFISQKKKLPQPSEEVSLIAVGDIMLSRTVASKIKLHNDINYSFLKVSDFLKSADITFANLENPITDGPIVIPFEMRLRADPGIEQALKNAGFDILSLANNHTPDFGVTGIIDTIDYLDKVGIFHVGAGQNSEMANNPVYISRNGITFAFLAYNDMDVVPSFYEATDARPGTAFMRKEKMVEMVKLAKEKADFVIISMHSGTEYTDKPNQSQINFARTAIDAGAELVIGHHPHVVQPIEKYNGKYILYSLGNFIFDQMQSDEVKQGLAVKIYFDKTGIKQIWPVPVLIQDYSQPKFLEGDKADKVLERLDYNFENGLAFVWDEEASQFQEVNRKIIKNDQINKTDETQELKSKMGNYEFVLEIGKLKITQKNKVVWKSPDDWWIDNFILADSNNDGFINVNLSVWKAGNFGSSKPFWVKENDMSIKNHFFVFNFIEGAMKPIWQSSNLTSPNCEFKIVDVDGDGKNDLVVIEGDYSQKPNCEGKYVAVWKWNGWGFSNEWRSESGNFRNLKIEKFGNQTGIVVD